MSGVTKKSSRSPSNANPSSTKESHSRASSKSSKQTSPIVEVLQKSSSSKKDSIKESKSSSRTPSSRPVESSVAVPVVSLGNILRQSLYKQDTSTLDLSTTTVAASWLTNNLGQHFQQLSKTGASSFRVIIDFDNGTCTVQDERGISPEFVCFELSEKDVIFLSELDDDDAVILSKVLTRSWEMQTEFSTIQMDDDVEEEEGSEEEEISVEGSEGDEMAEAQDAEEEDANEASASSFLSNPEQGEQEEEGEGDEEMSGNSQEESGEEDDESDDDDLGIAHGIIIRTFLA